MAETVVFSSQRSARVQRVQGARHVLVGLTLALAGWKAIADGHHVSWIDYLALGAGGLLLLAFVREMRAVRRTEHGAVPHVHHGINWVDVFAGIVTFVEAAHLHHLGKVRLPYAYGVVAILLLLIGIFHGRLAHTRRLIVDEAGFDIRLHPFSRTRGQWSDQSAIVSDDRSITMTNFEGRATRLDLSDVPERARVIDVFTRYAEAGLAPAPDMPDGLPPETDPVAPDPPIPT